MGEKEQQSPHPFAPAQRRIDTESTSATASHGGAREVRNKKRRKCILYIVLFIIFQTAIITLFTLTIMKVRTPRFRVQEATVTTFNAGAPARLRVIFFVKNANFGRYKYRNTTVVFKYSGTPVGEVTVPGSRANWRSTRVVSVEVDLNLGNGAMDYQLRTDFNAGIIAITSEAKMSGRVELLFVLRKNRSTDMNCSIDILTGGTQQMNTNIIACK